MADRRGSARKTLNARSIARNRSVGSPKTIPMSFSAIESGFIAFAETAQRDHMDSDAAVQQLSCFEVVPCFP
jgi:hypothetical protein